MGEANPEAIARIEFLTGHKVEQDIDSDGRQFCRIGEEVMFATSFALWSDPSVYEVEDAIFISWGGTRLVIPIDRQSKIDDK
jgi:hypothetical protein